MYRYPQSQLHALPIEPPRFTQAWHRAMVCTVRREVLHVGLGVSGVEGGGARTPGQPSFLACKPVLTPASCAPLVSHHREAA